MEFEEMKKIWDAQQGESLYAINERALHNRILSKKRSSSSITNISELLSIVVNAGAGAFMILVKLEDGNVFMNILAAWMFVSAGYVLYNRLKRIRGMHRFDRTMLGDLGHALSVATYQVRLSSLLRWNVVPIALFTIMAIISSGKAVWMAAVVLGFFIVTYFAAGWEHGIYVNKKAELAGLMKKLQENAV